VPHYIVENGNFVYHVPLKAFIPIESWVAVMLTNSLFGVLGWARRLLKESNSLKVKLNILSRVILERKHPLSCSAVVRIGRNCKIDPGVIIHGPTIIGNNVTIGAGSLIVSSVIGDNVNIMQGAQIVLSMVSNGCYIPFRAALYGTSFMENTMVAQNTVLQGCVVGRNTFIGGGNTFTDYNLMGQPIRTMHRGRLEPVGMAACGCAVGHDCRIGAGFVFYPGRTVESGTILIYRGDQAVIDHNVTADMNGQDPRIRRLYTADNLVINEDIGSGPQDLATPTAAELEKRGEVWQAPTMAKF
jgi:carbonic anhydrase/acetyltransferase-like protein (isoleucine patch superfamily)